MNKSKILFLICLIGTVFAFNAFATHTATVGVTPAYSPASTSTTYTVNVANGAGGDNIVQVKITKPTGYGDVTCNAVGGWTLSDSTVDYCTYTGSIAASANQDFTVTLDTAATTNTYAWAVETTDDNVSPEVNTYNPDSYVDATVPATATVTAPVNAARYKSGDVPATFTGALADDASGFGLAANTGTIYIKDNTADKYWDGSAWGAAAGPVQWLATTHTATTDGTSTTWTKNTNLPADGDYTDGHAYEVEAKATDRAGNSFTGTAITFVYDTTAPTLSTVVWSDVSGNNQISGTDTLTLTFSEAMDTGTVVLGALDTDLGLSAHTFGTSGNGLAIAWSSGNTVLTVTLGTDTTIVSGDTVNPAATVTDVAGNADASTAKAITDNSAPVLAESAAITGYSTTPSYTFTSTEAGTLTLLGSCSTSSTTAAQGSNTITLSVVRGTHYDCYVKVTDAYSNASTPLHITTFTAGDPYQGPGDTGVGAYNITITSTKTNPAVTKTTTTTITPTTTTTTKQIQNPAVTQQFGPITIDKPLAEMSKGELLITLVRLILALRSM